MNVSGVDRSYLFNYNTDAIPHLDSYLRDLKQEYCNISSSS